jgi:hypothetical protein
MSLIIPQLLWCLAAILALQQIISNAGNPDTWKKLKKAGLVTGGVIIIALMAYLSLNYLGENEAQLKSRVAGGEEQLKSQVMSVINALVDDRKAAFLRDIGKAILLVGILFFLLSMYARNKIKNATGVIAAAILLLLIDMLPVDNTYLNKTASNESAWSDKEESKPELTMGKADQEILKDTGWYRVLNLSVSPFQDASTSYFHKSIGGYHAAKIGRYQDLWDHKLQVEASTLGKDTMALLGLGLNQATYTGLNMLNTKYIIGYNPPLSSNERASVIANPNALGPCWFVREVKFANTLQDEMKDLDSLDASRTAIVAAADKSKITQPVYDSTAKITLVKNENDIITYKSSATSVQFAVFSEVYYSEGWNVYVDGNKVDYVKTNYVLRGMNVPAGSHTIIFKFEPSSYKRGRMLTTIGQAAVLLLLALGIFFGWRGRKDSQVGNG